MTITDHMLAGTVECVTVTPGRPPMYHLAPDAIADERESDTLPRSGQTVSGYGGRIPTRYMVRIGSRWHRVRAMSYSNGATYYVRLAGHDVVLP